MNYILREKTSSDSLRRLHSSFKVCLLLGWTVYTTSFAKSIEPDQRSDTNESQSLSTLVSIPQKSRNDRFKVTLRRVELESPKWSLHARSISILTDPLMIKVTRPQLWLCMSSALREVLRERESSLERYHLVSLSATSATWGAGQIILYQPYLHLGPTKLPLPSQVLDPQQPHLGVLSLGWDQGYLRGEIGPALRIADLNITPLISTRWARLGVGVLLNQNSKNLDEYSRKFSSYCKRRKDHY